MRNRSIIYVRILIRLLMICTIVNDYDYVLLLCLLTLELNIIKSKYRHIFNSILLLQITLILTSKHCLFKIIIGLLELLHFYLSKINECMGKDEEEKDDSKTTYQNNTNCHLASKTLFTDKNIQDYTNSGKFSDLYEKQTIQINKDLMNFGTILTPSYGTEFIMLNNANKLSKLKINEPTIAQHSALTSTAKSATASYKDITFKELKDCISNDYTKPHHTDIRSKSKDYDVSHWYK